MPLDCGGDVVGEALLSLHSKASLTTSQFSAEQIVKILEQAERPEASISALCREHGISATTCSRWRRAYGGMPVSETRRLTELEQENARLTRRLAKRVREVGAMKELRPSSPVRTCAPTRRF